MLGEPARTDFDVRFQMLGIPVRVHPMFWLISLVMGAQGAQHASEIGLNAGILIVIWVAVVFVSILIHELGHSLMMRRFGISSHIVLHMMGGLAIPDGSFGAGRTSQSPRNSILISAAGPGAGFLLAGLVVALVYAAGGKVLFYFLTIHMKSGYSITTFLPNWAVVGFHNNLYLHLLINDLLWVNIFWGLINLLPVYPLDGGQISRELFTMKDPWNGMVRSLWVSIITGAVMAVLGAFVLGSILIALLFGSLAFFSYQILQQFTGRGGGYGGGGYGGGNPW